MEYIVTLNNGSNCKGFNLYFVSGSLKAVKRIALDKALFKSKILNTDIVYTIEKHGNILITKGIAKGGKK